MFNFLKRLVRLITKSQADEFKKNLENAGVDLDAKTVLNIEPNKVVEPVIVKPVAKETTTKVNNVKEVGINKPLDLSEPTKLTPKNNINDIDVVIERPKNVLNEKTTAVKKSTAKKSTGTKSTTKKTTTKKPATPKVEN